MILAGLAAAIGRYRTALQSSKGLAARMAIGEALWWVAAADDFSRERVSQMGREKSRYYRELAESEEGQILAGLVYLRNRTGRQLALALEAKSEPAHAHFNVIQEDGSIETRAVSATVSYTPNLREQCPEDGYYFTQHPNYPDTLHRDEYYKNVTR